MKLRARLCRDLLFFKNAQAVEKIGRSCFIKFTPDYVAFGAIHSPGDNDATSAGGAIQCWSRLPRESLFHEYKIESKRKNEIYVEMKAEDLLLAMRSCNNNLNTIDMKMTGRSTDAYLSFTIASSDSFGNPRVIVQNVPIIKILTENNANDTSVFEEPLIPDPEVHIMLPHLERLRHVMSSYKNIADYVVVSANLAGDMVFTTSDGIQHQFDATFNADSTATENDDDDGGSSSIAKKYGMAEKARVETRFVKLFNPVMRGDDEDHPYLERQRTKPKEFASVLIRVLDLQKVLQSHYVKPLNVICSIVPSHSILFYVYIKEDTQDATLTYFIPEIK